MMPRSVASAYQLTASSADHDEPTGSQYVPAGSRMLLGEQHGSTAKHQMHEEGIRAPSGKMQMQEEGMAPSDPGEERRAVRQRASATARPGAGGRSGATATARPGMAHAAATARRQAALTARREADKRMADKQEKAQRERAAKKAAQQREAQRRAAAAEKARVGAAAERSRVAAEKGKEERGTTRASSSSPPPPAADHTGDTPGGAAVSPEGVPTIPMGPVNARLRLESPPIGRTKPKPKAPGGVKGIAAPAVALGGGKGGLALGGLSLTLPVKEDAHDGFQQWQEWQSGPVPKPKAAQAETDLSHRPRPAWQTATPTPLAALAEMAAGAKHPGSSDEPVENPSELVAVLGGDGCGGDAELAYDCLCQIRSACFQKQQTELVQRAKLLPGLIRAMERHREVEDVQVVACEILALVAGCGEALEGPAYDAGAIAACLTACEAHPSAEDVLGTAFEAIHMICASEEDAFTAAGGPGLNPYGDPQAWARKKGAVDAGALEVVTKGMRRMVELHREVGNCKWVHDAGMLTIGGLTKGRDENGHARRARARALLRQALCPRPATGRRR